MSNELKNKYDVRLVGAGPAGIFCAYELMLKSPELSVLLIDKGHTIYDRKCPILLKKIDIKYIKKNGHFILVDFLSSDGDMIIVKV